MNRVMGGLSFANVVSVLALVFALAGGAYAISLPKNSVKSKQIKNGQVKSQDARDNGLTGVDIDESTLGRVPTATSATTADSATTANSATTADSATTAASAASATTASSLSGLPESDFTRGRSAYDPNRNCDPTTNVTFTDCVGVTFSLPREGRVLLVAAGGQEATAAGGNGFCQFEVDGATVPGAGSVIPGQTVDTSDEFVNAGFALTAVTPPLPLGSHTYELSCNETTAGTVIHDAQISAVMIGSS